MVSRRQFFEVSSKGVIGIALAGAVATSMSGCAFNVQDILNWIPTATASISSILSLLVGAGVLACATCSVLANVALAAITAVGTAVQAYLNAPAANKTTLLGKIQTALQAALTASGQFFESVNVPDQKLFSLIIGIASLVLSAISGFIGQIGGNPPVQATLKMTGAGVTQGVAYSPKVYTSTRSYKADFNKLATEYGHAELVMH